MIRCSSEVPPKKFKQIRISNDFVGSYTLSWIFKCVAVVVAIAVAVTVAVAVVVVITIAIAVAIAVATASAAN